MTKEKLNYHVDKIKVAKAIGDTILSELKAVIEELRERGEWLGDEMLSELRAVIEELRERGELSELRERTTDNIRYLILALENYAHHNFYSNDWESFLSFTSQIISFDLGDHRMSFTCINTTYAFSQSKKEISKLSEYYEDLSTYAFINILQNVSYNYFNSILSSYNYFNNHPELLSDPPGIDLSAPSVPFQSGISSSTPTA